MGVWRRLRAFRCRVREPWSGFSHLCGLLLATVGAVWLVSESFGTPRFWASAVYAGSLVAMYAASASYHLVNVGERVTKVLRRVDHSAIFLLIAGTSTPFVAHALSGATRVTMLAVLWASAALGIAFRTVWFSAPRWLYTSAYVASGFVVTLRWRDIVGSISMPVIACIVLGAVAYIVGALVYAFRWPNPKPNHFGFHEVWHLFVLAASGLHFAAVGLLV